MVYNKMLAEHMIIGTGSNIERIFMRKPPDNHIFIKHIQAGSAYDASVLLYLFAGPAAQNRCITLFPAANSNYFIPLEILYTAQHDLYYLIGNLTVDYPLYLTLWGHLVARDTK